MTSERARRWGIVPAYYGWQGKLVETAPETEAAILAAMGAVTDGPPPLQAPELSDEACAEAPDRAWGWAIQLYALRSRASWGIGDLGDLRRFGRWARGSGASLLLLNPLGAQTPSPPYQSSPYFPSTRRFRNTIYLRVEDVDGAAGVDLAKERAAALELNARRLIDYDRVHELKSVALHKVFDAAPRPRGLASYLAREGAALREFAAFSAQRDVHEGSPEFHAWLQFHLDRQLRRAAREIGLITDVPVGFNPDGFDAWRFRDYFAPGMRIGAPPDEFFRDGQDWGLPPIDPWKLDDARWAPFLDAIRGAAGHAAGIRLDHVMGLFRLFWIAEGMGPAQGAYVQYPADVLLALLARESRRAGAFVVGEDLGLVEPVVREQLQARRSLSYRLVWFEPAPPSEWPHDAVGAIGTHDLPTVAGIWTRSDPEPRLHPLREKLVQLTNLPEDANPVDVAVAVYEQLARGRPRIVLASLEDALGVHERPNVPGTVDEFPNWRLALPLPLEDVEDAEGVHRLAAVMKAAGR
ncbi:MAG TPA: 4-alpha-glucanotransferase [Candidatus Dormibacteraeota bacterium]|nr:4-alpha-glucanotransferase [Candidatus Dormibacteraeota bacterium]